MRMEVNSPGRTDLHLAAYKTDSRWERCDMTYHQPLWILFLLLCRKDKFLSITIIPLLWTAKYFFNSDQMVVGHFSPCQWLCNEGNWIKDQSATETFKKWTIRYRYVKSAEYSLPPTTRKAQTHSMRIWLNSLIKSSQDPRPQWRQKTICWDIQLMPSRLVPANQLAIY